MENQEEQFYKIEDYLKGKLSEREHKAFEHKMKTSPSLSREVEKQRMERQGLEYILEKDLRAKMKEWQPAATPKKQHYLWWITALLLVVSASVWGVYKLNIEPELKTSPTQPEPETTTPPPVNTEPEKVPAPPNEQPPVARQEPIESNGKGKTASPQKDYLALAESAYTLPEHLNTTLKSPIEEDTANTPQAILNKGISAFSNGNYSEALAMFQQLAQEDSTELYEQAYEWMAHTHFQMQEFEAAAEKFRSIANSDYSAFILDRAEWYLLLSLLPNYPEHEDEAKALIEKMTEPENYHLYESSAKAIAAQLNE